MLDFKLSLSDNADSTEIYDLIIIGGGPAGLTAGLYAARYKLKTLMIEKAAVTGGQLIATQWVENYPGFPEPILGQKLAQDMESQARLFGLEIVKENVTSVNLQGDIKDVNTVYNAWKARSILIATGSSPRKLGIPNTALFADQVGMEGGYLITDRELRTSVEGVWAAGDVQAKALRQVATAVGDGALAAHGIHQYLLRKPQKS